MNVEVVRGSLTDECADEVLAFWAAQSALDETEARRRLAEVVCVLRGDDGEIAGVNSVFAATVPMLGVPLWIYRSLLAPAASEAAPDMLRAAHAALEAEFERGGGRPIGVCVLLADAAAAAYPQAVWTDPLTFYAGYLADGTQVRVAYFEQARIGASTEPPWRGVLPEAELGELMHGYRVDLLEGGPVDGQAVLDLWAREEVLPPDEAQRRLSEVLVVATTEAGALVGVGTVYLQHNAQLRMDMWYYRTYVARAHRQSDLARRLGVGAGQHLEQRFVSGEDLRAAGTVIEVENQALKERFDEAIWPTLKGLDWPFIGFNARGDHVRVRYYPGAVAPGP